MSDNILHIWLKKRNNTIGILNKLADELDVMQALVDRATIASTTGSIISGICVASAPFTGGLSVAVGAVAGLCGGVSTVISGGTFVGEYCYEKHLMQNVQNALDEDRWETMRMNKRVSGTETARQCLGKASKVVSTTKTIADYAAKKAKTEAQRRLAKKVAKNAKRVGHVLNAAMIPLNIILLVQTCTETSKGSTHAASTRIRSIISELVDERDGVLADTDD